MKPKLYGIIHCILVTYAQLLRDKHPNLRIRNATVFKSAIRELSRLGYIELVDAKRGIPAWLPDWMIRTIRRVKYKPIWMPGPKFPDNGFMEDFLRPSMKRGKIVWHHSPSKTANKRWARRRAEAVLQHRAKKKNSHRKRAAAAKARYSTRA